jgi:acetolactate synthase-1/2/3 large subunit
LNAKETLPDDHPLAVGVVGVYSRRCANQAVAEADLVFYVGSPGGSHVTNNWKIPPAGTRAIQLDIDPTELGRNYPLEVGLLGDAKVTLRRLIDAAAAEFGERGFHEAAINGITARAGVAPREANS